MGVIRIVPNIATDNTSEASSFYQDLLGLEVIMDLGWIVTYSAPNMMPVQISIATQGGSDTPVPDISIEVDDIDDVYQRAKARQFDIVYDLCDEPWGARRFYVRDPLGKTINILQHIDT